jgi:poly(U)-specific endoribonuclease
MFFAGVFTGSKDDFKTKLYELWFEPYDRDGTSATVLGSSGFEHVFMGETKDGEISGFHNWLHFHYEEDLGNINYLGVLAQADFSGVSSMANATVVEVLLIVKC